MNRCKARGKERKPQDHPALCFYQCKLFTALDIHLLSPMALQEVLACNISRGAASPSDFWALTTLPSTRDTMRGEASSKKAIWFPPAPTSGKFPSLVSARMTHLLRIRERKGHYYVMLRTADEYHGTFQGRMDSRVCENQTTQQRNGAPSAW